MDAPQSGALLQERFDEAAVANGVDPTRMPQSAVTRARLKSRGAELARILEQVGGGVRSELLLRDDDRHLFGVLDIAGLGPRGLILDLKTGRDGTGTLSLAVKHQMTFYAHLYETSFGDLPERLVVFGLQRGAVDLSVTADGVSALLAAIRAAQESEEAEARPRDEACRYCPKRMTCQPHWDALSAWDSRDAVEGEISDIEHSTSGAAALLIDDQWVTGLPASLLPPQVEVGRRTRVIRVRRRGDSNEWQAGRATKISVMR